MLRNLNHRPRTGRATGNPKAIPPWVNIQAEQAEFIHPDYLPDDFILREPTKMKELEIHRLLDFWYQRQEGEEGLAFRFHAYKLKGDGTFQSSHEGNPFRKESQKKRKRGSRKDVESGADGTSSELDEIDTAQGSNKRKRQRKASKPKAPSTAAPSVKRSRGTKGTIHDGPGQAHRTRQSKSGWKGKERNLKDSHEEDSDGESFEWPETDSDAIGGGADGAASHAQSPQWHDSRTEQRIRSGICPKDLSVRGTSITSPEVVDHRGSAPEENFTTSVKHTITDPHFSASGPPERPKPRPAPRPAYKTKEKAAPERKPESSRGSGNDQVSKFPPSAESGRRRGGKAGESDVHQSVTVLTILRAHQEQKYRVPRPSPCAPTSHPNPKNADHQGYSLMMRSTTMQRVPDRDHPKIVLKFVYFPSPPPIDLSYFQVIMRRVTRSMDKPRKSDACGAEAAITQRLGRTHDKQVTPKPSTRSRSRK